MVLGDWVQGAPMSNLLPELKAVRPRPVKHERREMKIKCKPGDSRLGPAKPIISLSAQGKQSYLWIGNDELGNKICFAHVSGPKTLEKFARAILKAVSHAR